MGSATAGRLDRTCQWHSNLHWKEKMQQSRSFFHGVSGSSSLLRYLKEGVVWRQTTIDLTEL